VAVSVRLQDSARASAKGERIFMNSSWLSPAD
jgi:hypothetical protein